MIKTTLYLIIGAAFLLNSINAQCLVCDSADTGACINPDGTGFARGCEGGARCYARVHEGRVMRGCQKDLVQSVLDSCSKEVDVGTCYQCNSTNCNVGLYPPHRIFCHHCDDSKNEGNCTQAIEGTPNPCRKFQTNDKCIVRQHGEHVIRECLSDYEDCGKEKTCKSCDAHGCNNEQYNAAASMTFSAVFIAFAVLMTKLF